MGSEEKGQQEQQEKILESSFGAALEQNNIETQAPDPLLEMTDLLKRTQANFENYRKQVEKRVEDIKQGAARDVMLGLLPIVDHLELALKHQQELSGVKADDPQGFVHGIELIYAQLQGLLEQHGVKAMESVGKKFDPYLHEPLMKVPSELPEGIIIEEFQRGYMLQGQVIRHAKVKVSAGNKK